MTVKKHQSLGFWMLTALVVGNMIGSGIFLLPAALAHFGTITIYSWILTAIGATFLALVFAKLSSLFPKTGGPYIYCRKGFGDFIGFQVAYNYWIYMWVGNAAIAVAFTGYLSAFFPELVQNNLVAFFVTAGMIWLVTLINLYGVRFAGIVQLVLTILKLVPLLLITFIAIFYIRSDNLMEFNLSGRSNFSAISGGAMLTLWAFLGLESASVPADEVKNPKQTIPRATIVGTLIVAVIYIVSTIAIFGVIPASVLAKSSAPYADLAEQILGPWGRYFMAGGAVISCVGALNGWILLQAQIPLAAAKDDLFPRHFSKLSKRGTPAFGLILSSCLVTLVLILNFQKNLVEQFTFIILLATLAAIVAYLYTTMAEYLIFAKHRETFEKKEIVRSLIIAGLGFVYAYWALISAGKDVVFYGSILLFSSLPIYAWMIWSHSKRVDHAL